MPSLIIKGYLSFIEGRKTWLMAAPTSTAGLDTEGVDSDWLETEDGTPDFNIEGVEEYIN